MSFVFETKARDTAAPSSSFLPVSGKINGHDGFGPRKDLADVRREPLVSQPSLMQHGVQPKLTIGQTGDKYEQEADRVAEQVMSIPEPRIRRQVESGEEEGKEEAIKIKPIAEQITPLVQRQEEELEEEEKEPGEEEEEEKMIQPKGDSSSTAEVEPGIESSINSLRGRGQPLPESVRNYFEPCFGHDFSAVRVHTGSEAGEIATAINAKAFTTGKDVVFGSGQYSPETSGGKRLLTHELTHVVQQRGSKSNDEGEILDIHQNIHAPSIQMYNKDVHFDETWKWAAKIFRPYPRAGWIPALIAKEDQGLDTGWTHPTWTSIVAFFTGTTPLHFQRRSTTIKNLYHIIKTAGKSLSRSFYGHVVEFGRELHKHQDTYSHSFPPGAPYNRLSNARKGAPKWLWPHLFMLQLRYPNTRYGRGAVIRHVLLGVYPDDFNKKPEQSTRDRFMEMVSKFFIRRFLRAYRMWLYWYRKTRLLRIPGKWRPSIFGPRRVP